MMRGRPGSCQRDRISCQRASTTRESTPTRRRRTPSTSERVLLRSTDAGKDAQQHQGAARDNHDLWIAPDDPKRMIRAMTAVASIPNAGQTWTDQIFDRPVYNVCTTTHVPYHVCGAQQDNSTPASRAPRRPLDVGGGESGYIARIPRTPLFYAGSYGDADRINRRTGERRSINVWPDNQWAPLEDMTERFQWTFQS